MTGMRVRIVEGDLLEQPTAAIVNAWNRNIIPWWLLIPQGVSRAIKRRGGLGRFREVARHGAIPLGGAVLTGAGTLPYRAIIHVAGIDMIWRASARSIADATRNALALADAHGLPSLAYPIIGAGSGGFGEGGALAIMQATLAEQDRPVDGTIVRFKPAR